MIEIDSGRSFSNLELFQVWVGRWLGGVDKLRIKLSQLEVEVEAELGNIQNIVHMNLYIM